MIQLKVNTGKGSDPRPKDETEAWERARHHLVFDPARVLTHRYIQVVDSEGVVLAVVTLDGVTRRPGDIWAEGSRIGIRRYSLLGSVVPDHPIVGRPSAVPYTSRNNFQYDETSNDRWLD